MGFVSWRRGWLRNIHRGWNYGTWQVKFNFVTCGLLWSAQTGLWGTGCGFFHLPDNCKHWSEMGTAFLLSVTTWKTDFSTDIKDVMVRCWADVRNELQSYNDLHHLYLFVWLILQSVKHHKVLHIALTTHFLFKIWRIVSTLKSKKSSGGRKVISHQLMNAPVQNEPSTQTMRQKVKECKRTVKLYRSVREYKLLLFLGCVWNYCDRLKSLWFIQRLCVETSQHWGQGGCSRTWPPEERSRCRVS